jgi:uncharacterized membrane protein YhaH (DUF805 family)
METSSPYSPPQTDLLSGQEEYGTVKILSASGRLGRLRYIAYSFGITLLCFVAMGGLSGVAGATLEQDQAGLFLIGIIVLGYAVMLVVNVLLTIQRCHDFDVTGWLSLVLVIPLVSLIFWFIPGTEGTNKFGPRPPPNKGAAIMVIVILLMVVVLGILAAIAIPAYQGYMEQAAAARM